MGILEEIHTNLSSMSTQEKWGALQLTLLFNCALGFGFFLGTLFIDSRIGGGASFQAVFTAIVHEGYAIYLLNMVKERNLKHTDFLGGIMVMMNVLLLETAALWGNFAGGMNFQPAGFCHVGGSTERFITVIASLIFLVHVAFSGLVVIWKDELLVIGSYKQYAHEDLTAESSPGQNHHTYQNVAHEHAKSSHSNSTPSFVIEDDGDAEL